MKSVTDHSKFDAPLQFALRTAEATPLEFDFKDQTLALPALTEVLSIDFGKHGIADSSFLASQFFSYAAQYEFDAARPDFGQIVW